MNIVAICSLIKVIVWILVSSMLYYCRSIWCPIHW